MSETRPPRVAVGRYPAPTIRGRWNRGMECAVCQLLPEPRACCLKLRQEWNELRQAEVAEFVRAYHEGGEL